MDGQQTALQQRLKDIEASLKRFTAPPVIDEVWTIAPIDNSGGGGGGGGTPGGSDPQVQWNNAGAFDGASRLLINPEGLPIVGELTSTTTPTTPSSGDGLTAWSRIRAGKSTLRLRDYAGADEALSPHFIDKPYGYLPVGWGSTTIDLLSGAVILLGTSSATITHGATRLGQLRRIRQISGTGANSNCGIRIPGTNIYAWLLSSTAGVGGVHVICRFFVHANRPDQRHFCGFWSAPTSTLTADPSTLTDIAGFMLDAGQTTMRWGVNDSSGTCTTTDLGASFPLNTDDTDAYELQIYWPAGDASTIYYSAENLVTGALAEGSSTTNLPSVGTPLWFYLAHALSSTTGTATSIDILGVVLADRI